MKTMREPTKNGMRTMNKLTWDEKVREYLENHKDEVFTDEFMEELVYRFLNCYSIRSTFKVIYPAIIANDIIPNLDIISTSNEQV